MSTTTRDKLDFGGQVAVVTGGARGIGRAITESLAALGADVAIADIDGETAADTAEEAANEHGTDVVAVEADVTDYGSAEAMVGTVADELGGPDVLVNNAGLWESRPFVDTDPEQWDREIGLCLYGTLNCSHAALPGMIDRGSGAIVNLASDSYKGNDPGVAVYGGAKAAVVSFTGTLAHEAGPEVRVNCVSPGMTETRNTEDTIEEYGDRIAEKSYSRGRLGRPEDIADAVTFLASDAADWITGETLSVNGGYIRG